MATQNQNNPVSSPDIFSNITEGRIPSDVKNILRSQGKNVSALEKEFDAEIKKGGEAKINGISRFYNMFDQVGGTNKYRNVLDIYAQQNAVTSPTPKTPEPAVRPNQPGKTENLPVPAASPQNNTPDSDTGIVGSFIDGVAVFGRNFWNASVPNLIKGVAETALAIETEWKKAGNSVFKSDSEAVIGNILLDYDAKKKAIKIDKFVDEWNQVKLQDSDKSVPFSYNKETKSVDWKNVNDVRSWANIFGQGAGSMAAQFGMVAATRGQVGAATGMRNLSRNALGAMSFMTSSLQMFPGYLKEAIDNNLSYSDAVQFAAPLTMVNAAIEQVGLSHLMDVMKIGKQQAQAVVRDIVNTSGKSAIKQFAAKEITVDQFQDIVLNNAKRAFKDLGDGSTLGAFKGVIKALGSKIGDFAKNGIPESLEEGFQGAMEYFAKELYNSHSAATGKVGDGQFENDRSAAITDTFLAMTVGGFMGGGQTLFAPSSKIADQTLFSYANADVRNQVINGKQTLEEVVADGRIFGKIEEWKNKGAFDIKENGVTRLDEDMYNQTVQNAEMMYKTAWDFRNYKDFTDLDRLDMFKIAKKRQNMATEASRLTTIKEQVTQLDQMIADPNLIEPDDYGNVPTVEMLELQRDNLGQELGNLDQESGLYENERALQERSQRVNGIIKQALPAINSGEKRLGRAFMDNGIDAIESLADPGGDDFISEYEVTLNDGSVVVMSQPTRTSNAQARKLVVDPLSNSGSVANMIGGNYSPVNRYSFHTEPIEDINQYREALSKADGKKVSRDLNQSFSVAADATELIDFARQQVIENGANNPATANPMPELADNAFYLYEQIAAHPDAAKEGVVPMSRDDFEKAIEYQSGQDPMEETILKKQEQLGRTFSVNDEYSVSEATVNVLNEIDAGNQEVPISDINFAIRELDKFRKRWSNMKSASGRMFTLPQIREMITAIESDLELVSNEKAYQEAPELRPVVAEELEPEVEEETESDQETEKTENNETTVGQSDPVNTEEPPSLESEYVTERELSQAIEPAENQAEQLRSELGPINEVPSESEESEFTDGSLTGLIEQIESVDRQIELDYGQTEEAIAALGDETIPEPGNGSDSQEGNGSSDAVEVDPELIGAGEGISREGLSVVYTPIEDIFTDTERFQNREAEFSESSVNSILNAVKNNKFDFGKFDPIRLWQDPENGRTYVLAGHSRREAFRRLSEAGNQAFDEIPSIFLNNLTEEQAIDYALNESNTLATQETDIEGAAAWRRMREAGKKDSQIRNDIGNRGNKARLELLSYLNPNGTVLPLLRSVSGGSESNTARLNQVAEFIGEAYKLYGDRLRPAHEAEMYDYLSEGNGKKITRRVEFVDRIGNLVSNITYDASKPLNLANRASKGSAQTEAENTYNELLAERTELEKQRNSAKSEENINLLDQQIRSLNKKIVAANIAIANSKVGDRAQVSLFSFSNPNTNENPNQIYDTLDRLGKAFPNITVNVPTTINEYRDGLNSVSGRELFKPGGKMPYGYINPNDGSINLDPSRLNSNTAIHEYGHIWTMWAKNNNPEQYQRGIDLIRSSPYMTALRKDPNYANLNETEMLEEALATAIGDKGERFITSTKKRNLLDWMKDIFQAVKDLFGIKGSPKVVADTDWESFANQAAQELLAGEQLSDISSADIAEQLSDKPLFFYGRSTPFGSIPGEKVGTWDDFRAEAEAALSSIISTPPSLFPGYTGSMVAKSGKALTAADMRLIDQVAQDTGWRFVGDGKFELDISKTKGFYYTPGGLVTRIPGQPASSRIKGRVAQTIDNGIELGATANKFYSSIIDMQFNALNTANIETLVSLMDDQSRLMGQLIKDLKRETSRRRSLALNYMIDEFTSYTEAMSPFTTYLSARNEDNVKTVEITIIQNDKDNGRLIEKQVFVPVSVAMSIARTEKTQRVMGAKYLTTTDPVTGISEMHSSLVLDDRHFSGGRLTNPNDNSILFGKDGIQKGIHLMGQEVREVDATGKLTPLQNARGKEEEDVMFVMSNAQINKLIERFEKGVGAGEGEVNAFKLGNQFFNNKKVQDLLAEENDKYLNPGDPFNKISYYTPLKVVTEVSADAKVNSFSPSLEDSKTLHSRTGRPDALYIQDDLRTAQYYMDGVGQIMGNARLVHNVKNIRDVIASENKNTAKNRKVIAYLDNYISGLQNFSQLKADAISRSVWLQMVNWISNKNTSFIFRAGIGISFTQSSTYLSALGQGHIQDKYLWKGGGNMLRYTLRSYTDSLLLAGGSVNSRTGRGTRIGSRFRAGGILRTGDADAIDFLNGNHITDPAKREEFDKIYATIKYRALNGNNRYIEGIDFMRNPKAAVGMSGTKQMIRQVDTFMEEKLMAPIRRSDRAVILAFLDAARLQVEDEVKSGKTLAADFDMRVAEITENTIYATNQMSDISETTGLQRSTDVMTRMVTIFTGQGQKLFNNLSQSMIEQAKYGKLASTSASQKAKIKRRFALALVSNTLLVPLHVAVSRTVWGMIKSIMKGDDVEEPEAAIKKIGLEYVRSVSSIVPGWPEQLLSAAISMIDDERWTQGLFEVPGVETVQGTFKSVGELAKAMVLGEDINDKKLNVALYNGAKLVAMTTGVLPKVFVDVAFARAGMGPAKPKTKTKDPFREGIEEALGEELDDDLGVEVGDENLVE